MKGVKQNTCKILLHKEIDICIVNKMIYMYYLILILKNEKYQGKQQTLS